MLAHLNIFWLLQARLDPARAGHVDLRRVRDGLRQHPFHPHGRNFAAGELQSGNKHYLHFAKWIQVKKITNFLFNDPHSFAKMPNAKMTSCVSNSATIINAKK